MSGLCLTHRKRFAVEYEPETKTGSAPCAICGKPVQRKKGVWIGHNLFRHKRCRAGTKRWLQCQKADPFYRYFTADAGMAVMADDYLAVRAAKHQFGMACERRGL